MRNLLRIVLTLVAIWSMTGCVEWLNDTQYRIECRIDKELRVDSVSLMLLEDSYNRVCHVSTVGLDSVAGAFLFEGQIEKPCVAFLKFDKDSTSFFFVLEHGETQVNIGANGVVVNAGDLNHEYMTFINLRNSILGQQMALKREYLALAAPDSVVNIKQEQMLARRDSILADSLERMTLDAINRGTPASRIIYDRFVSTLRPAYLRKVIPW